MTGLKEKLGIDKQPGTKKSRNVSDQVISGPSIINAEQAVYVNDGGVEFVGWRQLVKDTGYEESFVQSHLRRADLMVQRAVTANNHLLVMHPRNQAIDYLVQTRMEKLSRME